MSAPRKALEKWRLPRWYTGRSWDDWLVAPCAQHRDSDIVERCNWDAQLDALGGEREGKVVVVRERHFLCGWVEWLAIHPSARKARRIAEELAARLEVYPLLDEERLSRMEVEEGVVDGD